MMAQLFNRVVIFLLFYASLASAQFQHTITNTNFTISDGNQANLNYNRFRTRVDYTNENFFSTLIGDMVNYWGEAYIKSRDFTLIKTLHTNTPLKTQTPFYDYTKGSFYFKLYRGYVGYEDSENRMVAGLQNITMGVGRFWQPSNLFNPINSYALEPDEVFGVLALNYTRHINDMSDISFILSQREDKSLKYALRYKAFLSFVDVGVNMIKSKDTTMFGIDFEGNLANTGIEIRSEGAFIQSNLYFLSDTLLQVQKNPSFFQTILGFDYGFQNGITLMMEGRYSSQTFYRNEILLNQESEIVSTLSQEKLYLASSVSYHFNLFLSGSLFLIESFNDQRLIAPSLTYTLNDYHSFILGAYIQKSDINQYYLKYSFSF